MASPLVKNATGASFHADVIGSSIPVLVDFWAEWCGPCKMIAPMLDEIANENAGKLTVVKVDIDKAGDIASAYNVRSIPTLILVKGGQVKEQVVGVQSKRDLMAKITPHLA
jgi:thioredoxin 1